MNNIFKSISLTLLSLLILIGSSHAQESANESKTKKGCGGGCCSDKSEMIESDDHSSAMILKSADKNNDGVVFECPMKCEPAQDQEGECSKCGMKLKKVTINSPKENTDHKTQKMMDHSHMQKNKNTNELSNQAKNEK